MTEDSKKLPPSFSVARRWKIAFDIIVRTVLVLAVVVMANYIASLFPRQFYLSSQTRVHLSPRTISILQTLTNRVDATIYYDRNDKIYPAILALLNEYHRIDQRISVKVVDYARNPGEAVQIKQRYKLAASAKNLVIFESVGADPMISRIASGESLAQYGPVGMTKDRKIEYAPVVFNGEKMFTSMLLSVTKPTPFKAYFLQGDGEPSLGDTKSSGYSTFGSLLQENYIDIRPLSLRGSDDVPADTDLLIIAGPRNFSEAEVNKIDHYISQGGRLLVMFNYYSSQEPTGLENDLAHWGVNVVSDIVQDPANAGNSDGSLIDVQNFSQHPLVGSLLGSSVVLVLPRPVVPINTPNAPADAPTVSPLAFSGDQSLLNNRRGITPRSYPLMVAVEQSSVKGVANPNGGMRMVVIGDSLCFENLIIAAGANEDFAGDIANWLLDRPTLLNGIGPAPVTELRLLMTPTQVRNVRWLLLAALPGVALALGGLVWLRRRK